ncbi:protein MHF2 homolog [Dioscorea cayenensis subsp. rotundata]|uniref:Protein MHF2 homolog n=1 Tax=Dioscorea cayennensis subsp. rotundata TaxID=55577 RepID=A0AB40B7T5_DIOCR|nr:protein MHF2 homolog [Dioscorea cayenensis subsp. rotundata]
MSRSQQCVLVWYGDTFDPDLIHSIFKLIWKRTSARDEDTPLIDVEADGGTSKRARPLLLANAGALKISCELLRLFVTEAVQRAAIIAEAEGTEKIEPTHLERILPQLLLDF